MITAFVCHFDVAGFPRLRVGTRAGRATSNTVMVPAIHSTARTVASPRPRPTWSCTWLDGRPVWTVCFDARDAVDLSYLGDTE